MPFYLELYNNWLQEKLANENQKGNQAIRFVLYNTDWL